MNLTVNQLQWDNKVFLFGYSNGRDTYVEQYLDVIDVNSTVTNTFIFMGSDFLNVKLDSLGEKLRDWNFVKFREIQESLPLVEA